jgi:uncharacterized protein (TIGR00297 family)
MEVVDLPLRAAFGLLFSFAIAGFAYRRGSLSRSGALAALAIGTTIYLAGAGAWFLGLLTFFVTSTLLGKLGHARKEALKREFEKGDTRDARQAFSNGGVSALCALGMLIWPHPGWAGAFLGALATANGDTWATELGTLSKREPFSLTRFKRVPRGTSGAVSPLGMLATAGGGLAIGVVAAVSAGSFGLSVSALVGLGTACGVLGSLADSLLGATVQAGYVCEKCQVATEGALHHCGQTCVLTRGFAAFDNDVVNLVATGVGAAVGAGIAVWWGQAPT